MCLPLCPILPSETASHGVCRVRVLVTLLMTERKTTMISKIPNWTKLLIVIAVCGFSFNWVPVAGFICGVLFENRVGLTRKYPWDRSSNSGMAIWLLCLVAV